MAARFARSAGLLIGALAALAAAASASPVLVDFDHGAPQFETVNDGALWTLGLSGPDVGLSKPADPLAVNPQGFVTGGLLSKFCIDGDFSVTVDYALPDFPIDPSNAFTSNEAVLVVAKPPALAPYFIVLRYAEGGGGQRMAAYNGAFLGDAPAPPGVLDAGRFRITRAGDVLTGSIAPPGSEAFTVLGSAGGYVGPMVVELLAAQGTNAGGFDRANTSIEVRFDDLVVDGWATCPAAAPQALAGLTLGLAALGFARLRRQRFGSAGA